MSKVFIEEETLIGIGNAIREKSGTTDLIATTDMATAISNLPSGGGITYADLWYSCSSKTLTLYNQAFDVSNVSKLIFDYEIAMPLPSANTRSKWTLTAYKGYTIGPSSNTMSPTATLNTVDDNAEKEIILNTVMFADEDSIEIDVSNFTTIAFEV